MLALARRIVLANRDRAVWLEDIPARTYRADVVRRGEDGGAMRFDIARFTADVMAALR